MLVPLSTHATPSQPDPPGRPRLGKVGAAVRRADLSRMRIRKKLILLHTLFSLILAGILSLALRPAVGEVLRRAEEHEARLLLALLPSLPSAPPAPLDYPDPIAAGITLRHDHDPNRAGLDDEHADAARRAPGTPIVRIDDDGTPLVARWTPPTIAASEESRGHFTSVRVRLESARAAVVRLYTLLLLALLAVYALIALALEVFVLPRSVYEPINTILEADQALQEGRRAEELIPVAVIPADELGQIMTSRNRSVRAMRQHETDLAAALARLEDTANDLKRKNHLIETARRNLADADRLASLGIMSAGLAHEMNTPLAVLKGTLEKLNADPRRGLSPAESALLLRVVGRLERLSDGLLDFARVRPGAARSTLIRPLIEEAWTLVELDREARNVCLHNHVPSDFAALADPDRIVQVFVNLLRNAADALHARPASSSSVAPASPEIHADAHHAPPDAAPPAWSVITITDNGPGIDPDTLARLFQPFVSTRLDARGSGLGLAVSEGIAREHGGLLIARNRTPADAMHPAPTGAVFELTLPFAQPASGTAGE